MKKVNETVWKGILDRGRGETVRKEDEVLQEIQKALASYIDMFASIAFKGDYVVDSWPDFKAFVKDYREAPRMLQLRYNMENLLQYAEDHWEDVVLPTIEDAVNKVNATVDDIIDSLKDQNVNESTWGGMLDRGAGETVRKEDELTDEEMETLKQYISHYAYEIVYGEGRGTEACNLDEFCDFLEKNMESNPKIIDYVKTFWFDEICDLVDGAIEDRQNDPQEQYVNESTWGGILDRGAGETVRKEDDLTPDDMKYSFIGFAERIVYYEQYENTFDDFEKFMKERWNIFTDDGKEYVQKKVDYTRRNWDKGKVFKKTVDEDINRIEENIKKIGFEKEPGKTIDGTLDDWWDSLESYEKQDILIARGAEDNYVHPDEMWGDLDWTEKMTEYVECNKETNESTWGGMLDRGAGETVRKEDEVLNDDENCVLDNLARMCLNAIRIRKNRPDTKRGFIEYIEDRKKDKRITLGDKPLGDEFYDRLINYVNKNWVDCDGVQEFLNEKIRPIELKESVWGDVLDRGRGTTVRKEDDLTFDDIKFIVKSFIDRIVYFEEYKNKIDDLEDLIERSWNLPGRKDAKEMAQKQIGYVRRNWQKIEKIIDDRVNELEENIKKIGFVKKAGESPFDTLYSWWDSLDKKIQKEIIDSLEYDDDYDDPKDIWESLSWDEQMTIYVKWSNAENVIKECEGVPGGATPASVGGMGAAYFPGPDGTPGSGDLPSPTGIVYHQVAPYTMFLKQIKKKKKKSKKFRKEDEPCVHSPNAKVYDYVDDFREYVDRTYNQMDRRK